MVVSSGSSRARSVSTRRRAEGAGGAAGEGGVGDVGGDGAALALVLDVAGDGRQVGLAAGGVDVAVQLGAPADQAEASAEQVAQGTAFAGIGVSGGQVAALEQAGDGLGVLAVALGLLAV